MKKIGIMTIVNVNNYGAELQAFATQHILTMLGYDAELINYRYYKSWNFKDTEMSRPLVALSFKGRIMYWIKYRVVSAVADILLPLVNRSAENRKKRFQSFHIKNSKFSRLYNSMDELYKNIPAYDIYMTGSDQVWNYSASSSIEPYFLTFVPDGKRKISYAASFGVDNIPPALTEKYGEWLKKYDYIAVRETSGKILSDKLSGKEAELVVDPTLLLGKQEWMQVEESYPNMPEHYVLIYQLFDSVAIENLAIRIAKERNIPVYRICKRAYGVHKTESITNILDAGPAEFISLIVNASYLITNSFHGTAYAINLSVPFYTVVSSTKKNNSRMESLLNIAGLSERMLFDDIDINKLNTNDVVDFIAAGKKIETVRQQSIKYLERSLS